MNIKTVLRTKSTLLAVAIPVLIILLPLGYAVVSTVLAQGAPPSPPFLERPDKQYDKCVKETVYMRFHHMDLLKAIREEVVRDGKRGEISLNNCRKCHASRERFCNQCHNAVSLHLDCFGCHDYPEKPQTAPSQARVTNLSQPVYD